MEHQVHRRVHVPMDPRIRQRRVEVRRRQGRRRLRLLVAALLVLLLTVAAWVAARSSLLDVDRVRVEGAERTLPTAVAQASGVRLGEAMLDIDRRVAARNVEGLPWVEAASVRRDWPGTMRITVRERRPAAVTRTEAQRWALIDASGRVLEEAPEAPPGLPALEGLGHPPAPGAHLAGAEAGLAVVSSLTPALRARTTAVVVSPPGHVELRLTPRGTVRLGPPDDLATKVRAVETVLAQVDGRDLAILDVRYPSSPVLTRA